MKQQKRNTFDDSEWSEEEREIAQLLFVLPHKWYLLSQIPSNWVCRKKRSAIQDTPSPSSSQKHSGAPAAGSAVAPSCPAVAKEQASSPTTPLSFPATESDEKAKASRRKAKTSLKRKREYYLQIIQDLTKTKAELNQEIENVKRHCDQLKAFNLKLKAREQQLCNGPKSECKIPKLEICQPERLNQANGSVNTPNSTAENEKQKQKQQVQMQMVNQIQNFGTSQIHNNEGIVQFGHSTTSLLLPSSSTSPLGRNVDSNKGPLPIPDLNLSIDELTNVDSCQPLDETSAKKDLSRALAAQARQRRLQIFRLKNPIGNVSKPRQSYR